jgi:hypothetical protein
MLSFKKSEPQRAVTASAATSSASKSQAYLLEKLAALRNGLSRGEDIGLRNIWDGAGTSGDYLDFFGQPGEMEAGARQSAPAALPEDAGTAVRQDMPPPVRFEEPSEAAAQGVDMGESQVARLVQHMASFGIKTAEGSWRDRAENSNHHYDYFAA